MSAFAVHLEASVPARNHYRAYAISAGPDLLGDWQVRITYGRIGARGRTLVYAYPDEATARQQVRACLRRRRSAPARIGTAYQVRERYDPHGWSHDLFA